jgi:Carboxypeptidase regulatory-like domain
MGTRCWSAEWSIERSALSGAMMESEGAPRSYSPAVRRLQATPWRIASRAESSEEDEIGQTTQGLPNDGKTGRYAISYESSLPVASGLSVAQDLMTTCDQDFGLIAGWFAGTDFEFSFPVNVQLENAAGGASWDDPADISLPFGYSPTIQVKAVMSPPEAGVDFVRYLLVAEVTEMFMASKDNGWYEPTSLLSGANEGSKGEGLSRFLAHQFQLARAVSDRYSDFEVVAMWLNSPTRPNYVDNNPDDISPDVITGCTTCFLYYLHDQLRYKITDIINAGAASLGGVYQKLTGRNDAWQSFIDLVELHYPIGPAYATTGDTLFPVPNLNYLESTKVVSGSNVKADVALDARTPADVTIALASDNTAVLRTAATFFAPAGSTGGLVDLHAEPVVGPEQSVTIHASYAGQTVSAQVWVTPRPSVLAGVVTDNTSREPLANAVVLIDSIPELGGVHLQLSTGSDGSYITSPLKSGSYTIEASASGHLDAQTTVTIEEGVPETGVNLALALALPIAVAGTVSGEGGEPIEGAAVTLIEDRTSNRSSAATDGAGSYGLSMDPGPKPSDYTFLVAQPGYAGLELALAIPNGATVRKDVVLARLGSLTGVITDGSSAPAAPVARATVQAGDVSTTSDDAGRYGLELAPGPTVITVKAGGFENEVGTITVAPGEVTNKDFVLAEASAAFTGTVFDGNSGDPLPNAFVTVDGARSSEHTDFDGRYDIPRIPAGRAAVTVHAQGHATERSSVVFTAHETVSMNYYLASDHPDPHPPA